MKLVIMASDEVDTSGILQAALKKSQAKIINVHLVLLILLISTL